MQAGMHTWSFRKKFEEDPSFTIFDCISMTAEMGFKSIEIMSGKAGGPPDHAGEPNLDHLGKVLAHAREKGVLVWCFATYNDFAFVENEEWRKANVEYVKMWLGIAGQLKVPNIRMLTGYYNDKAPREELERLTREGIKECVPVAEKAGVNMAIENHNTIFMKAREILALIAEMGSPRLTACPDPSNWGGKDFFEPGCDPRIRDLVFDSAAKLAPKATDAHLKIRGIETGGRLRGWASDLDRLIASYRKAGYDGPIHFESIADGDLLAPLAEARRIVEDSISRAGKA